MNAGLIIILIVTTVVIMIATAAAVAFHVAGMTMKELEEWKG